MKDSFYLDSDKKQCIKGMGMLLGITYKDLAKYLGFHYQTIAFKMIGKYPMRFKEYQRIMLFLRDEMDKKRDASASLDEAYKEFER